MEYASNAKGNLGVALGAIGTGLGVVNGGANLFGMGNGMAAGGYGCPGYGGFHGHNFVTQESFNLGLELARKDSEIAMLKAEQESEEKMTEVYRQSRSELTAYQNKMEGQLEAIRREIATNRREQDMWNAAQSVANSQMSAAIATNTNSIATLKSACDRITKLVVPNSAICPGWGEVTVAPVTP